MAACPSPDTIGTVCKAGLELAAELASDMPVGLSTIRLIFPLGTINGLMIVGKPATGGMVPDPADVGEYLCTDDGARDYIQSGGTVDVLMNDQPFMTLSDCGEY